MSDSTQSSASHSSVHPEPELIEFFISCENLVGEDYFGKGDPFVVVYSKQHYCQFEEIGRTEVIHDTSDPKFAKRFTVRYNFNEDPILRFDVYDCDKESSKHLSDHDFIGTCTVSLAEIVCAKGLTCVNALRKNCKEIQNPKTKKYSVLNITSELLSTSENELITLQFKATNLPAMNGILFKKGCDPCFEIYRMASNNQQLVCVKEKSDPLKETLNPTWPSFTISSKHLCNGDYDRKLEIHVWDWDSPKKYKFIGKWITSCNELKQLKSGKLINDSKPNETFGTIECILFESKSVVKQNTFMDYIKQGCEISLMFGIDFTASNGDPKDVSSLHYIDTVKCKPNPYQIAIRSIGDIVSKYDTDNMYPVYGFGAQLPNTDEISHDFPLTFSEDHPFVKGVYGIEQAYINALQSNQLKFYENKLFAPILKKAIAMAKKAHSTNKENLQYLILVIITNDCMNDAGEVKDLIVSAANEYLPLSIIIVGIGNSHFPKTIELASTQNPLMNSDSVFATRNITNFVIFSEISNRKELTYATLKDIPSQFLSYVRYHKILPSSISSSKLKQQSRSQSQSQSTEPKTDNNIINVKNIDNEEKSHEHTTILNTNNINVINNKETNNLEAKSSEKIVQTNIPEQNTDYNDMPLPEGWKKAYDENGHVFYIDENKKTTQWAHPLQPKSDDNASTSQN